MMQIVAYNGYTHEAILMDVDINFDNMSDDLRQTILQYLHAKGWDDKHCWSRRVCSLTQIRISSDGIVEEVK